MEIPQSLADLDLAALVGLTVSEAEARVTAAGGSTRTVSPDGVMTMDYRPSRVTLVVRDGYVVATPTIG